MNINAIRSDVVYKQMVKSKKEDRTEIFRKELIMPFEFKYKCIGVPVYSEIPGGFDAVEATIRAGGYVPSNISDIHLQYIDEISNDKFWENCTASLEAVLKGFQDNEISIPVKDYIYTIFLNDPDNPISAYTGKNCGDGGIPGYIIGTIIPDKESLEAMPAVLSHEMNHNVRWQFMKWSNGITLADMIVSEGLAENQTAYMYGEEKTGQWVKITDKNTFNNVIRPLIHDHLFENDFMKVSTYLYGDDIMKSRGGQAMGVPYCAGYSCGYELIKFFLNKTGKNIYEATVMTTDDILKETEEFWK